MIQIRISNNLIQIILSIQLIKKKKLDLKIIKTFIIRVDTIEFIKFTEKINKLIYDFIEFANKQINIRQIYSFIEFTNNQANQNQNQIYNKYNFDLNLAKIEFELLSYIKISINSNLTMAKSTLYKLLEIKLFTNINLTFGSDINSTFDLDKYSNIDSIYIRTKSNKIFNCLPTNLENLYLSQNQNLSKISTNIENVYMDNRYNKETNFDLIRAKNIFFGHAYNKPLTSTNDYTTELIFGTEFNMQIDNLMPNIKYIKLGYKFNQSIDYLPNSLTQLEICSHDFNQDISNLPNSIINLNLNLLPNYTYEINYLPNSIKYFSFNNDLINKINYLPSFLKEINISIKSNIDYVCVNKKIQLLCKNNKTIPKILYK